jgi:transposase
MSSAAIQETEVVTKARRRSFTAEYKRDVLRQAQGCTKPGDMGALLRREGLYSSHVATWRREMEHRGVAGLAPQKRGPKVTPLSAAEVENRRLRQENTVLTARAERAEMLVEIQKKLSTLLGLELPKPDENS